MNLSTTIVHSVRKIFWAVLLGLAQTARMAFSAQPKFSAIESGLKKVEEEWVAGTFKIIPGVDEIFTPQMSVDWERSLARTSVGSYTLAEAETNRLQRTCDYG